MTAVQESVEKVMAGGAGEPGFMSLARALVELGGCIHMAVLHGCRHHSSDVLY